MSDIVKKYQHYFNESVKLQEVVNEQAAYIEELEEALETISELFDGPDGEQKLRIYMNKAQNRRDKARQDKADLVQRGQTLAHDINTRYKAPEGIAPDSDTAKSLDYWKKHATETKPDEREYVQGEVLDRSRAGFGKTLAQQRELAAGAHHEVTQRNKGLEMAQRRMDAAQKARGAKTDAENRAEVTRGQSPSKKKRAARIQAGQLKRDQTKPNF
jgi:hypothetical protein